MMGLSIALTKGRLEKQTVSMLEDLVNDFTNQNPDISDLELAKQVLDYIENDA